MGMNQTSNPGKGGKREYQTPEVVRVSLRPEEAVLGHCKVAGGAGPGPASCSKLGLSCKTVGS